MAFGAKDIKQKTLATVMFRGYSIKEVDEFLDLVATEFERLQQENETLREEVLILENKVQGFEHKPDRSIEERLEELERRFQAQ